MGRRVFNTLLFNLIEKYMKIIDTHYCQTKTFYAGGDKLENGLSLFEIAKGMKHKFADLIQKDVYFADYEAFAFDRRFIIDAYNNKPTNLSEYESNLINEIYDFFIKTTDGGFIGKGEYKAAAEYFVIHAGTHNHD